MAERIPGRFQKSIEECRLNGGLCVQEVAWPDACHSTWLSIYMGACQSLPTVRHQLSSSTPTVYSMIDCRQGFFVLIFPHFTAHVSKFFSVARKCDCFHPHRSWPNQRTGLTGPVRGEHSARSLTRSKSDVLPRVRLFCRSIEA